MLSHVILNNKILFGNTRFAKKYILVVAHSIRLDSVEKFYFLLLQTGKRQYVVIVL